MSAEGLPKDGPSEAPPETRIVGADLPEGGLRLVVVMDNSGAFHFDTDAGREDTIEALFAGGHARFRVQVKARERNGLAKDVATMLGANIKPFVPAGLEKR